MKKSNYPEDINKLAKLIVDKATGDDDSSESKPNPKNPAAVALGKLGGLKGGKARAKKLTIERRKEIARNAAKTRWKKKDD